MENKDEFDFEINNRVVIEEGTERGRIIGRAQYEYAEPSYQVRYRDSKGETVERWWTQSALEHDPAAV